MRVSDKVFSYVVRKIVEAECETWPPVCYGLAHQPERPTLLLSKEDNATMISPYYQQSKPAYYQDHAR